MSSTFYDAQNSYLTLGMEMIESNRDLRAVIAQENTMDKVQRLEALITYIDQRMAPYREFMRLEYFDRDTLKMVKIDDYEKAMRYIFEKIKENRVHLEDRLERPKYMFWILQWSGLISSAYSKLKMVPEMSYGDDDSLMQRVGVDREVIEDNPSASDKTEEVEPLPGVPNITENPYDMEDEVELELED